MDRKSSETPEIKRLIETSEASRTLLGAEAARLRHRLDVPARVRDSLKERPTTWMLGSLGSGLVASLIFRRKPAREKKKKSRGFSAALLGLTLTAGRPMVKIWLTRQLNQWVAGQSKKPRSQHLADQSSTTNPS